MRLTCVGVGENLQDLVGTQLSCQLNIGHCIHDCRLDNGYQRLYTSLPTKMGICQKQFLRPLSHLQRWLPAANATMLGMPAHEES